MVGTRYRLDADGRMSAEGRQRIYCTKHTFATAREKRRGWLRMSSFEAELRTTLRRAGLTTSAIDAVWPEWWSDEAGDSPSAATELRFTVARRLGIAPSSLLGTGSPQFVWRDETRFKNIGAANQHEAGVLASFSVSVGRCAIRATPPETAVPVGMTASSLRAHLLRDAPTVDLGALLIACWSFGIPVLHMKVFPLAQKRMHAVATRLGTRFAVLIARESRYASQVAYYVAHELGHILTGQVGESAAMLDVDDPLRSSDGDDEEDTADRFALELLTGDPEPDVSANFQQFNATQVAQSAMEAAGQHKVDPGVIALCLGHRTGRWEQVMGALKIIPPGEQDVPGEVNRLAHSQLDWTAISYEDQAFLETIMGIDGRGD